MSAINPIDKVLRQANITQEDLANLLGISRQTLLNYKNDADKIPISIIVALSSISGFSIDKLIEGPSIPNGPIMPAYYASHSIRIFEYIECLQKASHFIEMAAKASADEFAHEEASSILSDLKNTIAIAKQCGRKPTLCCFGASDAGKSSLTNLILNDNILPADYAPLTSTVVIIHHISEKPSDMSPLDNGIIIGRYKKSGEQIRPFSYIQDNFEKIGDINSQQYYFRSGDHASLLSAYSVRSGSYYDNSEHTIDEVHIYLDNDILNELTLVDVPGFNTGNSADDVSLTLEMAAFDIVLYLSPADSFMRAEDIIALQQIIRSRNDLNSLFVIATHSNAIGDPTKVKTICDKGCERLLLSIDDEELNRLKLSNKSYDTLQERFFGFDLHNEYYVKEFNQRIISLISFINQDRLSKAIAYLSEHSQKKAEYYSKKNISLHNIEVEGALSLAERENILQGISDNCKQLYTLMQSRITRLKNDSVESYALVCCQLLDREYLLKLLDERAIKNNRISRGKFLDYLTSLFTSRISFILRENSKEFANQLNEMLESYQASRNFNPITSFSFGLENSDALNALTTLADHDKSIVTAKFLSRLCYLGVSFGNIASGSLAIVVGTITLGAGIAILATMSALGILSGNWKSRFVSKIIDAYNDVQIKQQGILAIEKYWDNTSKALEMCITRLEEDTKKHYKDIFASQDLSISQKNNLIASLGMMYTSLCNVYNSDLFYLE